MYDNSYVSHKDRVTGFISIPYSKHKVKRKVEKLKITNRIESKNLGNASYHIVVNDKFTMYNIADKLGVKYCAIKKIMTGLKSVTINGVDYNIKYNKTVGDLYLHGELHSKNLSNKQAAEITGYTSTYMAQLKHSGRTSITGWSVKHAKGL